MGYHTVPDILSSVNACLFIVYNQRLFMFHDRSLRKHPSAAGAYFVSRLDESSTALVASIQSKGKKKY